MSRHIDLGTFVDSGKTFKADLDIILRSNALVQANSGGGKSWELRRTIEQAFKRVPQIVIDPEGEFSTLREKFDFVLVGKGGDTPVALQSAELLAHRLLELGASAIIDLYETSKSARPLWTATFIQALVDAPKRLWRDLLVYIDEAHELAPEPGHGVESRDEKLCRHALIDLAAKGRKRGYGTIAATQRLGKLSKDFAAELKNVLIGQTFIDIDRERAAGNLGIAKSEKAEFFKAVKLLEPGTFYALGRAFSLDTTLVKIGGVETEHPEAGRRQSAAPPPTEKIRHLLPQLADLPKEAENKVLTERDLKSRITELERELVKAKSEKKVETAPALSDADHKRLEKVAGKLYDAEQEFIASLRESRERYLKESRESFDRGIDVLAQRQQAVVSELGSFSQIARKTAAPVPVVQRPVRKPNGVAPASSVGASALSKCARIQLQALVQLGGQASANRVSVVSGYSITSSGFANGLSELRTAGLIEGDRNALRVTEAGRNLVTDVPPLPSGEELCEFWTRQLGRCEATLLRVVFEDGEISREDLAAKSGYSLSSSGFANALSKLRTLELVDSPRSGNVTISEAFK